MTIQTTKPIKVEPSDGEIPESAHYEAIQLLRITLKQNQDKMNAAVEKNYDDNAKETKEHLELVLSVK